MKRFKYVLLLLVFLALSTCRGKDQPTIRINPFRTLEPMPELPEWERWPVIQPIN